MNLTDPIFSDETKAREYFESLRWPDGAFCPHCGETQKVYRLEGKSHRPGLFHCNSCKGSFTVTTGSVIEESSHIKLHKWALGFRLYAASKKGFSAHQLHRTLGITYKSAWFMAHRIREAMGESDPTPIGGKDKTIEVDETYIKRGPKNLNALPAMFVPGKGWQTSRSRARPELKVLTLVERGGRARSIKVDNLTAATIRKVVSENASKESNLMTDEANFYPKIGNEFASHGMVTHSQKEYVRGNVHTNTIEGFFSIFKRGMRGVYQHCGDHHLHRYLVEFDFRYSNRAMLGVDDTMRTERAIKGAIGKRLTYNQSSTARAA